MSNARNLARLLPDSSGKIALPSQVSGVLPDANAPSGSVIQMVQTIKTEVFGANTPNFTDVTGMSVSITPVSASSRILVVASVNYSTNGGGANGFRLVRDSTPILIGDAAGSRPRFSSMAQDGGGSWIYTSTLNYLDSPATTSSITYKIQAFGTYSGTWYLNRSSLDRDTSQYDARTASSIIVMEIAA